LQGAERLDRRLDRVQVFVDRLEVADRAQVFLNLVQGAQVGETQAQLFNAAAP
jgi:hypothetical protein